MTVLKATLGGLMVSVTRWLLPPGCREHVLGDLQERYRSPFGYLADAAGAVPAAMIGQILRVTPLPFILLEAILIYASLFSEAFYSRPMAPLWMHATPSQLAAMTGLVMAGLLWRDSQGQPPAWGALRVVARPRRALRLKRTSFGRRLLVASVDARIYFTSCSAWVACLFWQVLFRASHLFPGVMTTVPGVLDAAVLIYPLRIWLRTHLRSSSLAR